MRRSWSRPPSPERLVPILVVLAAAGCGGNGGDKPESPLPKARSSIGLVSPAVQPGARLPKRYTCDGDDVSLPLRWRFVPRGTRELALLVEDGAADHFVHWSVVGLPARTRELRAGGPLPRGAVETENSFGDRGWGGPCPPKGEDPHHYLFVLYALKRRLGLRKDASQDEVRRAIRGVALGEGALTFLYSR